MANSYYTVSGITTATTGTDAHVIWGIWNPSSTRTIQLLEFGMFGIAAQTASSGFRFRRSTTVGTPASTITPTAEHHNRRDAAPDSGFTFGLGAYSAQPTLTTGNLGPTIVFAAVIGSGGIFPIPRGLEIPPGTGLMCVNRAAIITVSNDIYVIVEEI
jgi:hypothetical protein